MKKNKITFDYYITRDDEIVVECFDVEMELSSADLRSIDKHILSNHTSGLLEDLPEKILKKFQEAAQWDSQTIGNDMEYADSVYDKVLQKRLPKSLIELLSDQAKALLGSAVSGKTENASPEVPKETEGEAPVETEDEVLEEEEDEETSLSYSEQLRYWKITSEKEAPTKENTLYLPIRQDAFDAIVKGEKLSEDRVIKDSTFTKYLETDRGKGILYLPFLMQENNPTADDHMTWNGGIYPYVPKLALRYLKIAVGYSKQRDTALLEIDGYKFVPTMLDNGKPMRLEEKDGLLVDSQRGTLCQWIVQIHIRSIVEVHRAKVSRHHD